jgi:hypothetical protein
MCLRGGIGENGRPLAGLPAGGDRIHYFISTARLLLVTKLPAR